MDLYMLATQMGSALSGTGLRVYPYGAKKIEAPAAVITMPDEYRPSTYGRTARSVSGVGVLVLVRDIDPRRSALQRLYQYTADSGAKSVQTLIESASYTNVSSMAWTRTSFDILSFAGASDQYLSALLEFDADGVAS